jgi:hypothetical protein
MIEYGTDYPEGQEFDPTRPGVVNGVTVGSAAVVGSVGYSGEVLDDVRKWFARFVCVMDDLDIDLLTLWTAHTHLCLETYTTPRLQLDSPMPGSGKTTVLDHLKRLCLDPVQMASISSPALLTRMLDAGLRTILIDEVDRTLDPKNDGVGELIAVLNSGYRRGATRPVLVPEKGGSWTSKEMPTFAPVAMAGSAPKLPDDTRSRTIRVLLLPDTEGRVEESDWELIEDEADELASRLASWADAVRETVRTIRPTLQADCIGRAKERWSPLKRIAAAAGGRWEKVADELIRRDMIAAEMDKEDGMISKPPTVTLLFDLYQVWEDDEVFTPTNKLVSGLILHNPQMWGLGSNFGRELTVQRLGKMLASGFKIHSARQGDSPRGYYRNTLAPAWRRMGVTPLQKPTEPTEPVKPPGVSVDDDVEIKQHLCDDRCFTETLCACGRPSYGKTQREETP